MIVPAYSEASNGYHTKGNAVTIYTCIMSGLQMMIKIHVRATWLYSVGRRGSSSS